MRRSFAYYPSLLLLFCFVLLTPGEFLLGQESSNQEQTEAVAVNVHPAVSDLNEDERNQLKAHLQEAGALASVRRSQEMLITLDKAVELAPDYYVIYNLRGVAFSVLRDFDSARREFRKARDLEPKALDVRFNLAEMDFVTGKFEKALEQLSGMIAEHPKMPTPTYHLLRFKELICLFKLGRQGEASKLMEEFSPYEDTPVYHMAEAVRRFSLGEEDEAKGWIRSAKGIFKPQVMSNYLDALMEVGWMDSLVEGK